MCHYVFVYVYVIGCLYIVCPLFAFEMHLKPIKTIQFDSIRFNPVQLNAHVVLYVLYVEKDAFVDFVRWYWTPNVGKLSPEKTFSSNFPDFPQFYLPSYVWYGVAVMLDFDAVRLFPHLKPIEYKIFESNGRNCQSRN